MVLQKKEFWRKKDFPKALSAKEEKNRTSRWPVLFLLLGTILVALFLWSKNYALDWWEQIRQPGIYKVRRKNAEELIKTIGIKPDLRDLEGVKNSIELLLQDLQGEYGLYFYLLKQQRSLGIKEDQVFLAASVNKIPIMVSFYQEVEKGNLDEEGGYALQLRDIQDYGAGSMRYQDEGTKYQYRDLIDLMGQESDNTAAYVVVNLIGEKKIQGYLDQLGMENTSIANNTTTPKEMVDYLIRLYRDELVKGEAKEKILEALTKTDFEDRIPQGIPETVRVAHKTGNEVQVYNDCGIIFSNNPYVLCILTEEVVEEEAQDIIPKISRLIWEFVNQGEF